MYLVNGMTIVCFHGNCCLSFHTHVYSSIGIVELERGEVYLDDGRMNMKKKNNIIELRFNGTGTMVGTRYNIILVPVPTVPYLLILYMCSNEWWIGFFE